MCNNPFHKFLQIRQSLRKFAASIDICSQAIEYYLCYLEHPKGFVESQAVLNVDS